MNAWQKVQNEYGPSFNQSLSTILRYNALGRTHTWQNMKGNAQTIMNKGVCNRARSVASCTTQILKVVEPDFFWMAMLFDSYTFNLGFYKNSTYSQYLQNDYNYMILSRMPLDAQGFISNDTKQKVVECSHSNATDVNLLAR